jgi:hypothetical protein
LVYMSESVRDLPVEGDAAWDEPGDSISLEELDAEFRS